MQLDVIIYVIDIQPKWMKASFQCLLHLLIAEKVPRIYDHVNVTLYGKK